MQAVFYSFSKRKNSTALPSGAGETFEITLKNGCSFLSPTFLLSAETFSYNYCNFNGRYYWVTDITSVRNNLFEVQCSVDVLASWKNEIMATTAFVEYSSSDTNQNITDSRNIVTQNTEIVYAVATSENGLFNAYPGGIYVLCTMGSIPNDIALQSFCGLYVLDIGQLSEVATILNSEEVLQQLVNFFTNPTETVIFCRWFPCGFPELPIVSGPVTFGTYESSIHATILTKNYATDILDIEIPWQTEDFRKCEPFTSAQLYLPGVGVVPIKLSAIYDTSGISIHSLVDYVNNSVSYGVFSTSSGSMLGSYGGTLGAEIPIASVQGTNVGGFLASMGSIVAGYALGIGATAAGEVAGANVAMMIGGGVATGLAASVTQVTHASGSFAGGYSFYAGQGLLPTLTLTHAKSVQEPSEYVGVVGNPCMKTRQISGLTGFCKTNIFQVSGNMTETEKSQINAMMDGGVYIE